MLKILKILKNKLRGGGKMPSGVFERGEEYKKNMSKNFKGRKIVNGHWSKRDVEITDEERRDRNNAQKRQWRKDHPEESSILDKKYKDNKHRKIKQREYSKNWYWKNKDIIKKRRENGMEDKKEKDNFLHVAVEFLEKMKEKEDIDIDMINDWQRDITTLGIAIAKDFERAFEKKNKPIRKVWYLAIKAKEEDTKKYEKILDDIIVKSIIQFPEAKITKSLCN